MDILCVYYTKSKDNKIELPHPLHPLLKSIITQVTTSWYLLNSGFLGGNAYTRGSLGGCVCSNKAIFTLVSIPRLTASLFVDALFLAFSGLIFTDPLASSIWPEKNKVKDYQPT